MKNILGSQNLDVTVSTVRRSNTVQMHHHPANPRQDDTVTAGLEQEVNK